MIKMTGISDGDCNRREWKTTDMHEVMVYVI